MLRDKSLIPLSHQHQHALALCVRIERASPIPEGDLAAWLAEIEQIFQTEIGIHFAAEEKVVFPAARNFGELNSLVDDLLAEHVWLRHQFAQTQKLSSSEVRGLAQRLSGHIRKEERQLFERMQELMSGEQLAVLGQNLEYALRDAAQACILPTDKTRLRSAK
jgi:iron-sulfur cluster repair protein YtfE (RIC family)